MNKRPRKVYKGKFVERVRLYVWIDPCIMQLLELLIKNMFPHRKKAISLLIQKLIIDEALRQGVLSNNLEIYNKVMKIKEYIEDEVRRKSQLSP